MNYTKNAIRRLELSASKSKNKQKPEVEDSIVKTVSPEVIALVKQIITERNKSVVKLRKDLAKSFADVMKNFDPVTSADVVKQLIVTLKGRAASGSLDLNFVDSKGTLILPAKFKDRTEDFLQEIGVLNDLIPGFDPRFDDVNDFLAALTVQHEDQIQQ